MLRPDYSSNFKKDIKRIQKSGQKIEQLKNVIIRLINREPLEPKYRDHSLIGNYVGFRELHITADWLLIYQILDDEVIYFYRTGSHSQLF